jgi:hypothetical protein
LDMALAPSAPARPRAGEVGWWQDRPGEDEFAGATPMTVEGRK